MAFTLTSLTDLPGGQQVETHPTISIGRYQETLAGGADDYVVQQGAPSNDWLVAVRSIVSWMFFPFGVNTSPGLTLIVYICSDPLLGTFDVYNCYPFPRDVHSYMTGLVLPAVAARFRLLNAHATENIGVIGHVKIQGGF